MKRESESTRQPFSRVTSLGYRFYRLAHLFSRALDAQLARHSVTIGQFRVLLVLWEQENLTQMEIARHLGLEQPTIASTLRRMERDGLIKMAADPLDGRRVRLLLTKRGQMLKGALTAEAQAINAVAVEGLSSEAVAQLQVALDHMTQSLEAQTASSEVLEPPSNRE